MHMTRLVFIGYPEFPTSDAVLLRDISELNQDPEKGKIMNALVYRGSREVRIEEVSDPKIEKAAGLRRVGAEYAIFKTETSSP